MSDLLKALHKRNLRRKARKFYRAMKQTLQMEQMLWEKVREIDRRGDCSVTVNGEYELQDGFGFRLLNEDEILNGEPFPIHPACILNIAKNRPIIHNRASKQRAPQRKAPQWDHLNRRPTTRAGYTCINIPEPLINPPNAEQSLLTDYAIIFACFILLALIMFFTID